jgi:hypothetical protein
VTDHPDLFAKAPTDKAPRDTPHEIAEVTRHAIAKTQTSTLLDGPQRRLVQRVQVGLRNLGQYTTHISTDDVRHYLDREGVDPSDLRLRKRLASSIINGGRELGLWVPDGRMKSRSKRCHGREITRWLVAKTPAAG